MNSPNRSPIHCQKVIEHALNFLEKKQSLPDTQSTFGYFVKHPVARLNQSRMLKISQTIEECVQNFKNPIKVLDLCCGGGIIAGAVASLGFPTLGLDSSLSEITLGQSFAQSLKENIFPDLNLNFIQADLQKSIWENEAEKWLQGPPNVILLTYALHHLPFVEEFIKRLSQWLFPKSQDFLLVINEENPQAPLFQLKHQVRTWIQKDTDQEWHRSYLEWKKLLQENGFQVRSPMGLDPIWILEKFFPLRCWSLVFTAVRG